MLSLYAIGILMAVVVSKIFSTFVIKGEDTPFVMELPPYRWPTAKAIGRHTWEKGKEYLKKMGGIILVASIIVWALGYFGPMGVAPSMEQSYIGRMGQFFEPVFLPQGFTWQLDVSLIAGVGAKEIVASTIGVLGGLEELSPLVAYGYLLFVLLYFPCIATIVAIRLYHGRSLGRIGSRLSDRQFVLRLFVMIRLTFDDGAGAIDLLRKGEAYHLM